MLVGERVAAMVTVRRVEGLICIDIPFREVGGRRVLPESVRKNEICLKLFRSYGGFMRNDGKTAPNCYRYATNFGIEDDARQFLKQNGVEEFKVVLNGD